MAYHTSIWVLYRKLGNAPYGLQGRFSLDARLSDPHGARFGVRRGGMRDRFAATVTTAARRATRIIALILE